MIVNGPTVDVWASGHVFNPWYVIKSHYDPDSLTNVRFDITPACRVELPDQNIAMFFKGDALTFASSDQAEFPHHLVNPICYFLAYKTFVNYSIFGRGWLPPDDAEFKPTDLVRFKLERLIRAECENGWYDTGEEYWLDLPVDALKRFLRVLNRTAYYALAFYLIGCENPRYFLVEFYKAVEVIVRAFGVEKDFLRALGIGKAQYKNFKKVCNDWRKSAVDIGRHAPDPDAILYSINFGRYLFADKRSLELFECATTFCRNTIDSYTEWLAKHGTENKKPD